jgi:ferredoxin-NADP reductase
MSWPIRVQATRTVAPGVHQLTLTAPAGFLFRAGQFVILPMPQPSGAGAPGKPLKGFYSIASAPADLPALELLVEHREGGGPVSAWASGLSVGVELGMEGPLGHFGLVPGDGPCVFLGRRAGVAPLRSLILQALEQGSASWLFLGGDSPADWLLDQECRALAQRVPGFSYQPLLGLGPELAAAALAQVGPAARYHLAGFTHEVAPAHEALLAAGVEAGRINVEKFG